MFWRLQSPGRQWGPPDNAEIRSHPLSTGRSCVGGNKQVGKLFVFNWFLKFNHFKMCTRSTRNFHKIYRICSMGQRSYGADSTVNNKGRDKEDYKYRWIYLFQYTIKKLVNYASNIDVITWENKNPFIYHLLVWNIAITIKHFIYRRNCICRIAHVCL